MPKVKDPVDKPVERKFTTRGGGKAVRAAGGFIVDDGNWKIRNDKSIDPSGNTAGGPQKIDVSDAKEGGGKIFTRVTPKSPVKTYGV